MSMLKNLLITAALAGGLFAAKKGLVHELSAQDIAAQINARVALPLVIGEDVTLRRVTGQGDNLVFTYSLDNYGRTALDPAFLALLNPEDRTDLCRMIGVMREARIDNDIVVKREYLNSYGSPIHSVQMAVTNCG